MEAPKSMSNHEAKDLLSLVIESKDNEHEESSIEVANRLQGVVDYLEGIIEEHGANKEVKYSMGEPEDTSATAANLLHEVKTIMLHLDDAEDKQFLRGKHLLIKGIED